jgi:hypothetical protein
MCLAVQGPEGPAGEERGYLGVIRVEFLSAQPPVLLADSGKMDEVVVSSHFE